DEPHAGPPIHGRGAARPLRTPPWPPQRAGPAQAAPRQRRSRLPPRLPAIMSATRRPARPAELSDEQRLFVDALLGMTAGADSVDVRIGDVVEAAGSCRAAFYRAFGSKDELLIAAINETARRIAAAVRRQLPADPSP